MRKFKTESKKLLDLMINSIYTNREIFLRELISNASDAIDKLYLRSLTDAAASIDQDNLAINVSFDAEKRTITVADNGIGMTGEELDRNLGTIAHSGSEEFKEANADEQGDAVDIIGRFGVGFYSAFIVGKWVDVYTRAFGSDETWHWSSDGIEGYTVAQEGDDVRSTCGTSVVITLKDNTDEESYDEYLNEYTLKNLVKRYSNYVRYPVQMLVTKTRALPKPEDAGDDYKPEYESYQELETINSMTPIWRKRAGDVTQEEYDEFYKATFHDFAEPARTFSLHAEGTLEYDALLFIPSVAPFDLYSKDYEKGLQLYSSNVLIQEKCADLLPDYYNFVKGVVDSADLNLNISRETIQQTRQLKAMARRIEKKITDELVVMRDDDREGYEKFFETFGLSLKGGIYQSYGAKADELGDLLLFWSAREGKMVTLAEYAQGMPEGQECIYYAAGEDKDLLAKMPVVKSVLGKGFDVLLCTHDVDEFVFQMMQAYHFQRPVGEGDDATTEDVDFVLKNVSSGDLDLATEDEKRAADEAAQKSAGLFSAMKDALGSDLVSEVTVSSRLTSADDAPSCITAAGPMSLEMERVLSREPGFMGGMRSERVLELNAQHPVFQALADAFEAKDTDKVNLYAELLYDQALLTEGLPVPDPVKFAQNVAKLMK